MSEIFTISYIMKPYSSSYICWESTEELAKNVVLNLKNNDSSTIPVQNIVIEKCYPSINCKSKVVAFFIFDGRNWLETTIPDWVTEYRNWAFT